LKVPITARLKRNFPEAASVTFPEDEIPLGPESRERH